MSKIRSWAMEIMAVHASSLCACTCTLAKYVAKSNLIVVVVIVVVVIVVVIFVVSRQFKRSTAILKNLGQSINQANKQASTHTAVFIELLRN